jgi:rhomboid protease GluP
VNQETPSPTPTAASGGEQAGGGASSGPNRQPISVHFPKVTPIVTYSLLVVTIGVFLLQIGTQSLLGYDLPRLLGIKLNSAISNGEFWRLITPIFLHGSLVHIGFNMYALYVLGPGLERYFGHWRFLVLYFLGGLVGNVASFIFTPAPSLGASTAIFGLLAAEGVFLYVNRNIFVGFARRALSNVISIALLNLAFGFLLFGIDNWGHLGGLVAGSLFTWFGGPILMVEGIYPELRLVDQREPAAAALAALGIGALAFLLVLLTLDVQAR